MWTYGWKGTNLHSAPCWPWHYSHTYTHFPGGWGGVLKAKWKFLKQLKSSGAQKSLTVGQSLCSQDNRRARKQTYLWKRQIEKRNHFYILIFSLVFYDSQKVTRSEEERGTPWIPIPSLSKDRTLSRIPHLTPLRHEVGSSTTWEYFTWRIVSWSYKHEVKPTKKRWTFSK